VSGYLGAVRIWLDDARDPQLWLPGMSWMRGRDARSEGWVWVRIAPEAIGLLAAGDVAEVSLDHDLGEAERAGEGYDILLWVEQRVHEDPGYAPPVLHVHSSNLGARGRMEAAIAAIERAVAGRRTRRAVQAGTPGDAPDSTRPILLVDVDGVGAVPPRGRDRREDGIEFSFPAHGYKIRVPFGIRERFARSSRPSSARGAPPGRWMPRGCSLATSASAASGR